ncbi:MAG: hypothetical protein ACTHJ3_05330, partial [Pararhizobium sp.]
MRLRRRIPFALCEPLLRSVKSPLERYSRSLIYFLVNDARRLPMRKTLLVAATVIAATIPGYAFAGGGATAGA